MTKQNRLSVLALAACALAAPFALAAAYDRLGTYVPGLWVLARLSCLAALAVLRARAA